MSLITITGAMFIMFTGGWYLFDQLIKLRQTVVIIRNRARLLETQVLLLEEVFKSAASVDCNAYETYAEICKAHNLECKNKELQRVANYNKLQAMQSHFAEKRADSSVDWDTLI